MHRGKRGETGHLEGRPSIAVWKTVAVALLVVVAIGSVIVVVAFDATKFDVNTLDPTLSSTSRHGAAGFAIALGVFLIGLVTVLPYVALSRLRYRVAESQPAERLETAAESVDLDGVAAGRS